MRALITGGAGFIGSHTCDRFLAAGYSVVALDDLSAGRREHVPSAVEFHQLDIRSRETEVLIRDGGFDVVCHLAAQIDVRRSVVNPTLDASINIIGTLTVLEAIRALEPRRRPRLVFASTGGALYGEGATPPSNELTPKNPDAPYGVDKLAAEYHLAYYGRVHGMECVALRFGNVYGPRQDPHGEAGVIAIFCGRLQEHRPFTVFGDGSQTRDYIYVEDVAEAFLAAAESDLPPVGGLDARAFNIGTGVETSVLEVAEGLRRLSTSAPAIEHLPARPGEISRSCLDTTKAGQILGWRAKASLEGGLSRTWQWGRDGGFV